MDPFLTVWIFLIGTIAGTIIGITLVYRAAVKPLKNKIDQIKKRKQSQSVKYGKTMEQIAPFTNKYPYDTQKFRFIGTPIDGIQFNEDEIIFVEFKTNKSKLSTIQKKIKKQIKNQRVGWMEYRI